MSALGRRSPGFSGEGGEAGASTSDPALRGGLDQRVIAQILHHIAVSTYHMRMYGEANDQVVQSLEIVASSVNVLAPDGALRLAFREGRRTGFDVQPPEVTVNGIVFAPQTEEAAWVQSVVSLAKRAGWATLTLSTRVTWEECLAFFQSVSRRLTSDDAGEAGNTSDVPETPHIVVERIA